MFLCIVLHLILLELKLANHFQKFNCLLSCRILLKASAFKHDKCEHYSLFLARTLLDW